MASRKQRRRQKHRYTRRKTQTPRRSLRLSTKRPIQTTRRVKGHIAPRTVQKQERYVVAPLNPQRSSYRASKIKLLTNTTNLVNTICSKRKSRREVIHALNKSGQGGQKKARWSSNSHIKC
jgi:hypothetical protein